MYIYDLDSLSPYYNGYIAFFYLVINNNSLAIRNKLISLTAIWGSQNMEIEYSGGGVLIFSYLIFIHQLDNFGGLREAKLSRGSLIRVSSLAVALMARQ